jgi:hypothetical protein
MWRVYYDNGVDSIVELGTYISKKKAIVAKKTFIFDSTKVKTYPSTEDYYKDFREYNLQTIIVEIEE